MQKQLAKKSQPPSEKNAALQKKIYSAPQLLQFGQLSVITQGTGTMNVDAVSGRRKN